MSGYAILAERRRASHDVLFGDDPEESTLRDLLPTAAGALAGAIVWGAHPVLGALFGSAVANSVRNLVSEEETPADVGRRLGTHAIATFGALAVPALPVVGYGAGVLAAKSVFGTSIAPSLDEVRAGKRTVERGMKGESVRYVQAVVEAIADGEFGPKTEAAVVTFQTIHKIPATGVVDQRTMKEIDRVAQDERSSPPTAEKPIVIDFSKPDEPPAKSATTSPTDFPVGTPVRGADKSPASDGKERTGTVVPFATSSGPNPGGPGGRRGVMVRWNLDAEDRSRGWTDIRSQVDPTWITAQPGILARAETAKERFLAAMKKPISPGSSVTVWQAGLLGLGGLALLGAGARLLAGPSG